MTRINEWDPMLVVIPRGSDRNALFLRDILRLIPRRGQDYIPVAVDFLNHDPGFQVNNNNRRRRPPIRDAHRAHWFTLLRRSNLTVTSRRRNSPSSPHAGTSTAPEVPGSEDARIAA